MKSIWRMIFALVSIGIAADVVKTIFNKQSKEDEPIKVEIHVKPDSIAERKFYDIYCANRNCFNDLHIRLGDVFGTNYNAYLFYVNKKVIDLIAKIEDAIVVF